MLRVVLLAQPLDPNVEMIITMAASDVGLRVLLSPVQDAKEVPIAFFYKTMDSAQRNYAANGREALDCLLACEH